MCRTYSAMEKSEEKITESVEHPVSSASCEEKPKTYHVRHVTKNDQVKVYTYGGQKKARTRIDDAVLIARHKVARRITSLKNMEDIRDANDALSTVFGEMTI